MRASLKKNTRINFYVLGLILISTLLIIPFFKSGQLAVHSDWSFHSARVQQLFLNLKRGHFFTYIATDTFSKVGNGNFLFYPTVFLYPWAFLKFIFAPVQAYLIYVWLLFIATSLIAYYSMLSFSEGNFGKSFYFAFIYLTVPYHFYLTLTNYVIGEAQAYMFIPLAFLGIYNLLYRKKWITLAVGLSLMSYCHYISCLISVEICLLIFIVYLFTEKKITVQLILNIFKSFILFILLASWQLLPLITDYMHKGLIRPNSGFFFEENFGNFIVSALSNFPQHEGGIGLILVITLFLGWISVKGSSTNFWSYFIGITITIIITTAFPWQYFANTFLADIQFPYRYTSYAAFFLSIISADILAKIQLPKVSYNASLIIMSLCLLVLSTGSLAPDHFRNNGRVTDIPILTGKYKTLVKKSDKPVIIDNKNYNNQFSYGAVYGETDYFPTNAAKHANSILNRITYIDGKSRKIYQVSGANKLLYSIYLNKASVINLPALSYENSTMLVNGKKVKWHKSSRGTFEVKVQAGLNKISISYRPVIFLPLLQILSLITWLSIAGFKLFPLSLKS